MAWRHSESGYLKTMTKAGHRWLLIIERCGHRRWSWELIEETKVNDSMVTQAVIADGYADSLSQAKRCVEECALQAIDRMQIDWLIDSLKEDEHDYL
jgi:hypothetical protein